MQYRFMVAKVSDALENGVVVVRPDWQSFEQTIKGLIEQLHAAGRLSSALADPAIQRIHAREAVASTAMVDIGVSIPHARLDSISGIVAAMAVSPTAVYQVADGLPISIVVLVLSSPALTGEHLNFLSAVSMLLQSAGVREQLRHAGNADEVLQLIRRQESGRA